MRATPRRARGCPSSSSPRSTTTRRTRGRATSSGAADYITKPFDAGRPSGARQGVRRTSSSSARTAPAARGPAHARARRGAGAARRAARERAGGPTRRRDRQPREGRVPRDRLARASHAAQRDPRLDGHRAAPRVVAGGRTGPSRPSSATRGPRCASSRTCSTSAGWSSGKLRLEIAATRVADAIEGAVLAVRPAADAKGVRSTSTLGDPRWGPSRRTPSACSRSSGTCSPTPSSSRPSGGHVEVARRPTEAGVSSGSATTARASAASSCRTSSSRSGRRTAPRRAVTAGWAWGSRSCSSSCRPTAARVDARARARERDRRSPSCCPTGRDGAAGERSLDDAIEAAPTPPARCDGVRLLVVDDDEDSRDLLACLLEDRARRVASASSASEAIRLLRESPPDVLAQRHRHARRRRLRAHPQGPRHALRPRRQDSRDRAHGVRAPRRRRARARGGLPGHVTKPVDPDKLTAVIASLAGVAGP